MLYQLWSGDRSVLCNVGHKEYRAAPFSAVCDNLVTAVLYLVWGTRHVAKIRRGKGLDRIDYYKRRFKILKTADNTFQIGFAENFHSRIAYPQTIRPLPQLRGRLFTGHVENSTAGAHTRGGLEHKGRLAYSRLSADENG